MQLLIILALLLLGGKNGAGNMLSEVRPVLESFGGDEIKEALKSAEQISSMLSAVQGMAGGTAQATASGDSSVNFPLAPISAIADKDITYSLSRYIAQN